MTIRTHATRTQKACTVLKRTCIAFIRATVPALLISHDPSSRGGRSPSSTRTHASMHLHESAHINQTCKVIINGLAQISTNDQRSGVIIKGMMQVHQASYCRRSVAQAAQKVPQDTWLTRPPTLLLTSLPNHPFAAYQCCLGSGSRQLESL